MNWVEFLEAHQIDYATRGPNTKRGEVSIKCPWCGEDDPSEHMGISLDSENWGCLRNPAHRGHKPERLLARLLGCSWVSAKLIVKQYSTPDPEGFSLSFTPEPSINDICLATEVLPEVRSIKPTGLTAKFWRYLTGRGFKDPAALIRQYDLSCCLTGRFKDRLIIPVHEGQVLVAWTGRAIIDPVTAPRYLSSSLIKTTVFNLNTTPGGGKLLFITEGPFDALKLDYYGRQLGARATCTFGTSITAEQILKLRNMLSLYKKAILLFDADAVEPMYVAMEWLNVPNLRIGSLPFNVKDPGALNKAQIEALIVQSY